jgi:hypothetical protein
MKFIDCETGEEREGTELESAEFEAFRASIVPDVVSARQMKLALLGAGLLDTVEAFVALQPREVQISWEYAIEFRRDDLMLADMAEAFGMGHEQVSQIFRAAAAL